MRKSKTAVESLREHLGIIRSCALMMAHAQSAQTRETYLKTLASKIREMEAILVEMEKPQLARAAGAGE